MNLSQTISLYCTGTSEGAKKAWDSRGRGAHTERRADKDISKSEAKDKMFQATLTRLKADKSLTDFEREHIVPLTRGYTEAAKALKNGPSTEVHAGPYGGYSKERADWHSQLLAAYEAKFGPPQEHPVALITGGLAGSGKTSSLREMPGVEKFIQINADDIKEAAPEYNGTNAGFLHEESDEVARAALERAVDARQHVVIDATMRSPGDPTKGFDDSLAGKIAELSRRGYEVHLAFSDIPIHQSIERAVTRYYKTGRFVPPEHIKTSASKIGSNSVNLDNFRKSSKMPEVSGWKLFDNTGTSPKLVERGGKEIHV